MTGVSIEPVHEFLQQYYHPDIVDLAAEFPSERSLSIDWSDVQEYKNAWTTALKEHPESTIDTFEQALATYPAKPPQGRLGFIEGETNPDEAPFVRFAAVPLSHPDQPEEKIGRFIQYKGRLTEIEEVQARVGTAVFECTECGHQTIVRQIGSRTGSPTSCSECGTTAAYDFDGANSIFADTRRATLDPLDDGPAIDVEFRHELVEEVRLNSDVEVVGILYCTGLTERRPDLTLLANSVTTLDSSLQVQAESYLETTRHTEEGFTDELRAIVQRSKRVLKYQQVSEEGAQAKLINPLLHLLGWDMYSSDVQIEYSGHGGGGQVDYMLHVNHRPTLPIEAKSPGTDLEECLPQLERYMDAFDCAIGLLSTGEEYKLYGVTDKGDVECIFTLKLDDFVDNTELVQTLSKHVIAERGDIVGTLRSEGFQ